MLRSLIVDMLILCFKILLINRLFVRSQPLRGISSPCPLSVRDDRFIFQILVGHRLWSTRESLMFSHVYLLYHCFRGQEGQLRCVRPTGFLLKVHEAFRKLHSFKQKANHFCQNEILLRGSHVNVCSPIGCFAKFDDQINKL